MDPRILKLETTSRCNARCVFCGHTPGGADMDFELFRSVIDAFPEAEEVQPQFYGEPLLWPHIAEGVRYVKASGKRCVFYTNGSLLKGSLAREIADAAPDKVIFSVDTHIPELYEVVRPPLSFDALMDNMAAFQVMKSDATLTVTRSCITAETAPTMDATLDAFSQIVDKAIAFPEMSRTRTVADAEYRACTLPSYEMVVRANGDAVLCCNDWYSDAVLGNVTKARPADVWSRYQRWAREKHAHCEPCPLTWKAA